MRERLRGLLFLVLGTLWVVAFLVAGALFLFSDGHEGGTALVVLSFPAVAVLAFVAAAVFRGLTSAGASMRVPVGLWLLTIIFGLCSWTSGNTKGKFLFWYTFGFGVLAVLFDLVIRISGGGQTARGGTEPGERDMPDHLRDAVLARDDYRCRYCGRRAQSLHIDHIVPVSQGGKSTFDNLATACSRCNLKKGGRTPDQAGMQLLPPRATLAD